MTRTGPSLAVGVLFLFGVAGLPAQETKKRESQETQPAARQRPGGDERRQQGPPPPLSPELTRKLGQLMGKDWKDRPEWSEMMIAVLKGERMGMGMGWWKPSTGRYDFQWLKARFDANKDGKVQHAELTGRDPFSKQLFARLDRDGSGGVTAEDFDWSENSRFLRDGSTSGLLFYKLDVDSNGRVTKKEIEKFFKQTDRGGLGYLTREDFREAFRPPREEQGSSGGGPPADWQWQMMTMLLTGQLGSLTPGPAVGQPAPDFTLKTHDGKSSVTLSKLRREKPVVLIFGSFT